MNSFIQDESPKSPPAQPQQMQLHVQLRRVIPYGPDINCYEIVDAGGATLPAFEPGSHIDVFIPAKDPILRQYSLCGDPADRSHYIFAVQREANGRGGSKAAFEVLKPGIDLAISSPRNNFMLQPARRYILLAGGIGVTPMISMIHHFLRHGGDFELHYCTRSPDRTAFVEILQPLVARGHAFLHWDDGDPTKGLDITSILTDFERDTHLYYCGPPGFMSAVAAASAHWPSHTIHREYFTPSANDPGIPVSETAPTVESTFGPPFKVKIASTGQILDVPGDMSLLSVLRSHDFEIETQCELGICGTCRIRYLEGDPDHRDFVLEAEEHEREMTVCCSRAKSPLLVLDL